MVVIVFIQDLGGPRGRQPAAKKVSFVSYVHFKPKFFLSQIEPGEAIATTKEEEWVSKKKTEVTNTKQIETRVKRQVVLEDGKVVEDSGPVVTTNTTEDTETQEHHQTELRKSAEDDQEDVGVGAELPVPSSVAVVANPDGVVREVNERKVVSREEREEVKETEDVRHLGDITDEDYLAAVNAGEEDIRRALKTVDRSSSTAVVAAGPRLVRDSSRSRRVTDTEETRQLSSVREDGRIVTETERTTEHEELKDDELPDGLPDEDVHRENSQRYFKSRDQEQVDYLANGVKIGEEMRYKAETMEVERRGDGVDEPDWDSLSARARRRNQNRPPHRYRDILPGASPMDRKDALTRRPLDLGQEEETRMVETSKWLVNHFGSESRSSRDSLTDDDDGRDDELKSDKSQPKQQPPKTSYFNVTIKSQSPPPSRYFHGVSEWTSSERTTGGYREYQRSPAPDYARSPPPPENHLQRKGVEVTPTPPQRKKALERRQKNEEKQEEPLEEPPPDYSPPSPQVVKKFQKTRFAEPAKPKSGNIIGQSIRKLVGKIRSASAERKAKQRAKRSPSPSYQKGHVIDRDINHDADRRGTSSPVHRYYLGEDPFGGSIYGRENKYDGVRPVRISRRYREEEGIGNSNRSQSTLGRFSKSTGRLSNPQNGDYRASQTLPRHVPTQPKAQDNTINVSIINTQRPIVNGGPAKPARTYKSNLSRSQSFNVQPGDLNARRAMHKSNPQLNRLDGLKSPALISSINRSQQNLNETQEAPSKRVFTKGFDVKKSDYAYDIYEPPTRLRDGKDYSETFRTTSRSDDPDRPSVTDTVRSFSKRTIPAKDGRPSETVESTEKRSVTRSHYAGPNKYYEDSRRYAQSPVVIEVRNYRK